MGLSLNVYMINWYHSEQGRRTYGTHFVPGYFITESYKGFAITDLRVLKNFLLTDDYILKIGQSQCTSPACLIHYLGVDQ